MVPVGNTRGRDRARGHQQDPFLPRSIPGMLACWDALSLTHLSDFDPVALFPDRSGSARSLSQATASARPTFRVNQVNGRPAVAFDGVDDSLTGTSGVDAGSDLTLVVVCKVLGSNSYGGILTMGQPGSYEEIGYINDVSGGNMAVSNFAGPTATAGDRYTTTASNDWHIATLLYEALVTPSLFKNGGSALSYTTAVGDWSTTDLNNGANDFPVAMGAASGGGSPYQQVMIAMAMLYQRALSAPERLRLEHWLGGVFDLAVP